MKHSGAEIIVRLLERQGVETIAGIPGGANLPLYDALHDSEIRHVLARHEQGAGFIAQGMARVTNQAAVCMGTSGPGATNLLTAIADAKLDSIPVVAITGQVPQSMIGTDAFQEVDTYGLTLPITKHNYLARSAAELLHIVPDAFRVAMSGRPGPVVIDVPKDVQREEIEFDDWPAPGKRTPPAAPNIGTVTRIAELVNSSKRPVFYIGGGVLAAEGSEALREIARRSNIPVTWTLMGSGAFPTDDPLSLGMLGMHGARYCNLALEEADLLLAFGVRFDDRATGKADEFCPGATIVHVDIDKSEIGKIKTANLAMEADVGQTLKALIPFIEAKERPNWNKRVGQLKEEHPFEMPATDDPLNPLNLVTWLGERLDPETVITTDVGQHQMWVAQVYPFRHPRTLLTSGGLGTMGFGLPAAIGAALARPDRQVVCVSGDGSFVMNVQELATLADLKLNVKVLIMNNVHLGLVRQQQELFYGQRYLASRFETVANFAAVAEAFGIRGVDLEGAGDPTNRLEEALTAPGPCVINVPIHFAENVFPMVPPGAANRDMIGGTAHVNS